MSSQSKSHSPRRALILIDVQNEYVGGGLPIEYPDVDLSLANIARAVEGAGEAGIPIVVVQNSASATAPIFAKGSWGWQLHPVVAGLTAAHVIEKHLPSAFVGTDLASWLTAGAIDTVTVAGYMTQNCVDSTIRQALHEGWAVEYLSDASGAVSFVNRAGGVTAQAIHEAFSVVLQSRFAAVLTTEEWITALASGVAPERDTIIASHRKAHQDTPAPLGR